MKVAFGIIDIIIDMNLYRPIQAASKRLGREIKNFIENAGGACEFLVFH